MILGINCSQSVPEDQSGTFFKGEGLTTRGKMLWRRRNKRRWDLMCRRREEGLDEEGVSPAPLPVFSWRIAWGDYGGPKWALDGFGKPLNSTFCGPPLRNDCQWSVWSLYKTNVHWQGEKETEREVTVKLYLSCLCSLFCLFLSL